LVRRKLRRTVSPGSCGPVSFWQSLSIPERALSASVLSLISLNIGPASDASRVPRAHADREALIEERTVEIMVARHRILFPVDFSNYPFSVSTAVGKLIDRPDTEVILSHVIDAESLSGSQLARRMQMLDKVVGQHFSHCTVTRRIEHGSPADRIVDYIRENEIEMVVMAARDSGGFGKGPLGRVASGILRDASCPVWLEWRTGKQQEPSPVGAPRICCAIDGAQRPEQMLRDAIVMADRLGGNLTIVSAVQPRPYHPASLFHGPLVSDDDLIRETDRMEKLCRRIAPTADVVVAAGWCEAVISRAVRDCRASLLITGDCRQAVLAAEATCPVLRIAYDPGSAIARRMDRPNDHRRVA
jgi:nucleotide-binding universal stress UspA family protein